MDNMEQMLNSVMSDPQAMEKIMALAQSLGGNNHAAPQAAPEPPVSSIPEIDMQTIQRMASIMGKTGVDSQQRALLNALRPYIGPHRLGRLERAMQAAKMAALATGLMGNSF